mgnify:CR=1 FL=1
MVVLSVYGFVEIIALSGCMLFLLLLSLLFRRHGHAVWYGVGADYGRVGRLVGRLRRGATAHEPQGRRYEAHCEHGGNGVGDFAARFRFHHR